MHFPGRTAISATALAAVLVFAAGNTQAADEKDKISPSVIQQGIDISPIPFKDLKLKGKDPAQVALGSYLTNAAGDCNGCHTFPRFLRPQGTTPGTNGNFTGNTTNQGSDSRYGNPYLDMLPTVDGFEPKNGQLKANTNTKHFLAGGRCFGFFMSRNLTPNDYGLPRGLTEDEFIQVMRQGKDISCDPNRPIEKPVQNQPIYGGVPDPVCSLPEAPGAGHSFNAEVLQTMPWPTYHSMTDSDLKAIYAYLSALPQTTACNAAQNGCAGFSNDPRLLNSTSTDPAVKSISDANKLAGITVGANKYIYPNTDDCPNNVNPAGGNTVGTSPPQ